MMCWGTACFLLICQAGVMVAFRLQHGRAGNVMNRWRLDWTGDTCGPVRVRCTRPRGGLAVAEVVGTSDRKRVCGQELRGRGVGEAEGGRPFGLTQLIRRAVDPGLEKLVGGPVGLSAVHRSLPQHATLAPALGLGQDGEVLGHELRAADGVGADRHRADRAHDAALKGGGKDRAASAGLHPRRPP